MAPSKCRKGSTRRPSILSIDEIQDSVKDLCPKERRRERNKLLARRSRMRTKIELEQLQTRFEELKRQNDHLKNELANLQPRPFSAMELVTSEMHLPENLANLIKQIIQRKDKSMTLRKMEKTSFCISNATTRNCPLVYASQSFLRLTGYQRNEILGKNCKFLQGAETDPYAIEAMSRAVTEGKDISITLLNYRKDGTTFWNDLQLAHIKDNAGRTIFIVGIQKEVYYPSPPSSQATLANPFDHCLPQSSPNNNEQLPFPQFLASPELLSKLPSLTLPAGPSSESMFPSQEQLTMMMLPDLVTEEIKERTSSDSSTGSLQ
jgi:PAS domain S-box-containing protein